MIGSSSNHTGNLGNGGSSIASLSCSSPSLGGGIFPSTSFLWVASQVSVGGQVSGPASFSRWVFSASMAAVLLAFSEWVSSLWKDRSLHLFFPVGSFGWAGHIFLFLTSFSLEKMGVLIQAPGLQCLRPVITKCLIIATPGQGADFHWRAGENLEGCNHLISKAALLNDRISHPRILRLLFSSDRLCIYSTLLLRGIDLKGVPVFDQVSVLKGCGQAG